ncbi:MAG: hypothetical protein AAGB34_11510, partial [Planctomycetota bacterium]
TADRLVVEILADGSPVPPEHLDAPPADDPYASEMQLRTAAAGPLVAESLMQACEAIDSIAPRHAEAAQLLQSGNVDDAMKQLAALMSTWQQAQTVIDLAAAAPGVSLSSVPELDKAATEVVGRLNDMKEALDRRDFSDLADILIEDMPEMVDLWTGALRKAATNLAVA